jgi:pyrimidine operon attenuation protein/uracil phosphoribosyltransferase
MLTSVLEHRQINQKIVRIAYEIIENLSHLSTIHVVGIEGNGVILAEFIVEKMKQISGQNFILGTISVQKDNPFLKPVVFSLKDDLTGSTVILVDDVINSGKTMQYALNKILEFDVYQIKTVALVDRKHRRFPVHADFVGIQLSTTLKERVEVSFDGTWKAYLV